LTHIERQRTRNARTTTLLRYSDFFLYLLWTYLTCALSYLWLFVSCIWAWLGNVHAFLVSVMHF